LGRFGALVDLAAQLLELRLDVVACDLAVDDRGRLAHGVLLLWGLRDARERAIHTSAAAITSAATTIAYGTHDQLPCTAHPRFPCSARSRPIARNEQPMPMRSAPASPNPIERPRPLSGSVASCLAYAITRSFSSRTVCCGLSATRLPVCLGRRVR